MFRVKEEFPGGPSSSDEVAAPQPVEGLYEIGPPPFLTKTFEMVDDRGSDHVVSWSRGGQSFVVWDPHAFSAALLPKYFKHSNFSSFVRQLNTYGFRKIDSDKWEFANEAFLRGQRHNLKQIRRRKTSVSLHHQSLNHCAEAGSPGLDAEMERLRREKQVLVMELIKLRQQDQTVRAYLQQMEVRLHNTERKQDEMMSFLARVMQKPEFLHQLVHRRKRQRTIEAAESSGVKVEPVSELEALALEMQGHRRSEAEEEEEVEMRRYGRELDEGFWEELLNEGFDEHGDGGEVEDVEVLADKLGFSCSPY